jgi:hypothetical protein
MNQPEDLDPIDALLREQNAHVDDDGFTARVLMSLPPRRRAWLRPALLLGAAAVGSVLSIRWLPWNDLLIPDPSALLSLNFQALTPWLVVLSVVASVVCAVAAAVQIED